MNQMPKSLAELRVETKYAAAAMKNGEISYWFDAAEAQAAEAKQLPDNAEFDVVIVGGGLTGLWAAYYLTVEAPWLSVAVLEQKTVGYGASGRNGGWLSHLVPGNRAVMSRQSGRENVVTYQRAMVDAIDEVMQVASELQLDIDQTQSGNVVIASSQAGMKRLLSRREADLSYGIREDEVQVLDANAARSRINADHIVGGLFYPAVTSIQPAKLVQGLARVLEARGVSLYSGTQVTEIADRQVATNRGPVLGGSVLVCTEGYSGPLLGKRKVIPINSSMIITEQLSVEAWKRIGWSDRETFSDASHVFIYSQRTADNRIAIGGRGYPYRFGSGTGGEGEISSQTIKGLMGRLQRYFPDTPMQIDHAWSGVLGVTRDWCPSVVFDQESRVGHAYGYAGHGVTATNLAARSLVDQLLNRDTPLTKLPWSTHRSPSWEPEPIRWVGVHSMYSLFGVADWIEEAKPSDRTSLIAKIGMRIGGIE